MRVKWEISPSGTISTNLFAADSNVRETTHAVYRSAKECQKHRRLNDPDAHTSQVLGRPAIVSLKIIRLKSWKASEPSSVSLS